MKVTKTLVLFAFICASFALPLQAQQPQSALPPPPPQVSLIAGKPDVVNSTITARREYLLGPNDVVELRVFGEPQFDGAFTVDEDGFLPVPFIEQAISVQCRSVKAVRKEVIAVISKFIKNPFVYLSVREERSRTPATVYGAVRSPAPYEMRRPARLLELISKSGGVTEQQSGTIQIFHTQPVLCPGPEEMKASDQVVRGEDALGLPFTVYSVEALKQGKSEANPYVHPGDVIYVAEASPVYVTGNVLQPANLYLKDGMTLHRVLSQVGGPKNAQEDKVRIYRQKPGTMTQEIVTVDYKAIKAGKQPDIKLQPYDVIEVPEKGRFGLKNLPGTLINLAMGAGTSLATQAPLRILY